MRPVVADWLGRRAVFRLPLAGLFAIEDECGRPAWDVLSDMLAGKTRIEQLEAVLFHGLLGAGVSLADACAVIDRTRQSGGQVHAAVALAVAIIANALEAPSAKGGGEGEPFNRKSAYRSGFAMGLRPADVDAMALWEFLAAVEAFSSKGGGLSEVEKDELWEWIRQDAR
ncbi:GTA-gp10 family protein [Manganibacter manganicus]|uniref:Gene transfer agent family protein n=1 Tax=Manganibacter manganicus TaxID=1873176 RepID=A0A1V8RWN7_9HYPH|nr:GTA-gp10 family protein [Pseudaminobacter manganicus]OQM77573.1 hypothetical protein BFN67_01680 [Pseudaminobacter manganicus]